MARFRLTAICFMILTLAGCSQATTDSAKPASDKAGTAQSQPPPPSAPSGGGGGGGDGGGGY